MNGTKTSTKTVKTRIAKARVVRVGAKRFLVVKVKSSHKRVKVAIRLRLANGKVLNTTRKVHANKAVRVMRLSWAVKSVKVTLAKSRLLPHLNGRTGPPHPRRAASLQRHTRIVNAGNGYRRYHCPVA